MKLRHITHLLVALALVMLSASCGDSDNNNDDSIYPMSDAQIYSFALTASITADDSRLDSIAYYTLNSTKFVIANTPSGGTIYNPDSLPYKAQLRKFAASVSFNSTYSGSMQIIYPEHNDSTVTWSSSDSIDFSQKVILSVYSYDGSTNRRYNVDIRVHQEDPDTIIWNSTASLPAPATEQKTLEKDGIFYSFAQSGNTLQLSTWNKTGAWTSRANVLTAAAPISLRSITLINGTFCAIDASGNSYNSTNGTSWTSQANGKQVTSILGVLPSAEAAKDSMLVVFDDGGTPRFAKTKDMAQLVAIDNMAVPAQFPVAGFSSFTNYDRADGKAGHQNMLLVGGGVTAGGATQNIMWYIKNGTSALEIISSNPNTAFTAQDGMVLFWYNDLLYALTDQKLYTSASWGSKWTAASDKESLPAGIYHKGQSVITDSDNYIWIVGGATGAAHTTDVWQGRLNKLKPRQ